MPNEDEEAETLRVENERLAAENSELRKSKGVRRPKRLRRMSAWVVLVLACLLAVVSVLVVFVRNEALNTDKYVNTVAPLAHDPAIQAAVANAVSNALLEKVNVKTQIQDALPAKADFLATPIAGAVSTAVHTVALKAVQSDQFAQAWTTINRSAHTQLVALLTGSHTGAVSGNNGEVTLNLGTVASQVKSKLDAKGITIFDKINTGNGPTLVLFKSTQLAKAQKLTKRLNQVALILPLITILLFAGSVLLAINRRKGFTRAAGGMAVSMGVLLAGFDIGRNQYLHALPSSAPLTAAESAYDIITAQPLRAIRIILVLSLIAAVIALALGNTWLRAVLGNLRTPSWLEEGPFIQVLTTFRRAFEWIIVVIGGLILFTWDNPTPLVVIVVVLVVFALVALIAYVAKPGVPGMELAIPGASSAATATEADTPVKPVAPVKKDTPVKKAASAKPAASTDEADVDATDD